jgi:hypothetical protein
LTGPAARPRRDESLAVLLARLTAPTHPLFTCVPARDPPSAPPPQDGKTLENELDVVEGMKFDRGYIRWGRGGVGVG